MRLQSRFLLFNLLFLAFVYLSSSSSSIAQSSTTSSQNSTRSSDSGSIPTGRSESGRELSPDRCPPTELNLITLVPYERAPNHVTIVTLSEQPTLLFYIPFSAEVVQSIEFTLQTIDGSRNLYVKELTPPTTPGIVSFNLPPNLLVDENPYFWFLGIRCSSDPNVSFDHEVYDSIQRVTPLSSRFTQGSLGDFQYDKFVETAQAFLANPQATDLKEQWSRMLESINRSELADMPFAGVLVPVENNP